MAGPVGHVHPDPPEPSIGATYRFGWRRIKAETWPLLSVSLVFFLAIVLAVAGGVMFELLGDPDATTVAIYVAFTIAFGVMILVPMAVGMMFAFLEAARGHEPGFEDLFAGFTMYRQVILAVLAVGALVLGGLVLLVVPGVVIAGRLLFVPLLVVDQEVGLLEAVTRSWERTRGKTMDLSLFVLSSIPLALLGFVLLGLGIIPAMMLYFAAVGGYYRSLMEKEYVNPMFSGSSDPSPS